MFENSLSGALPATHSRPVGGGRAPRMGFVRGDLVAALEQQGPLEHVLLALWRVFWRRHGWEEQARVSLGTRDPIAGLRLGYEGDPSVAALAERTGSELEAAEGVEPTATQAPTCDFTGPETDAAQRAGRPGRLGLAWSRAGRDLSFGLSFDPEHFELSEVERFVARLEALIRSAAIAPGTPVSRLGLLPEAERHTILQAFNDTAGVARPDVSMVRLIAESVERNPDAPAVFSGDRVLTYAELDRRSTLLAARLRGLGVGPDSFAAVHAEPSPGMLVGLVAVLKAGGAYVPLDPEYPDDRLAFMLEDSASVVLLTQAHLRPIPGDVPRLVLDDEGLAGDPEELGEGEPQLGREPEPTDLAYLIYTSGSTGKPKGVRVDHRNLVHSTRARNTYYGGPVGRFLLLSSFAFDSSVAGLFWTLIDGGALVLPPAGAHRDPVRIGELMARHGVTHTLCLASHWRVILAGAADQAFASLDTSIVSGEVFSDELVRRHDERAPGTRLFNEYGPTEGSVWSTVFDCHAPYPGNKVPIGKPIENTQIYLLDEHREPVPIGVPGEMYQGGAGVAQGYLERPELTAERFVPDHFSNLPGARLYRCGDLASFLPSGDIVFLGRLDDQVKIRGYRIELGEIEAVLGGHAAVREVAVLCRPDELGELRLLAYVVREDGATETASDLRAFLAETLPAYMLPSATVFLDALPRTSIGKLAPERLPEPPRARPDTGVPFVAARNTIEEALAAIWAECLSLEQVGVDDDFFALGGHSILAIRIMSRIKGALGVELAMRTFFDHPTVAGLAAELSGEVEHAIEQLDQLSEEELDEQLARRSLSANGRLPEAK